jgi:hypothetical protein
MITEEVKKEIEELVREGEKLIRYLRTWFTVVCIVIVISFK